MRALYNEIDPYCCDWLSNLMDAGLITPGRIDDRSIADLSPDDARGYKRAHFFAGIAGWDLALNLAGWGDRLVWTGSCPCQPFSAAGKGKAADDERHLWPAWFSLIRECSPATIFGEQVEAAIGWGWLDAVFTDLEAEGYACGATVLPACGGGAPHIRQRLWFVADRASGGWWDASDARDGGHADGGFISRELADTSSTGLAGRSRERTDDGAQRKAAERAGYGVRAMGHATSDTQRQSRLPEAGNGRASKVGRSSSWSDCLWLPCTDGKARPVEPGTFPLAHGIPGRVGRLRAYGNAIVPQVAAEFIKAAM